MKHNIYTLVLILNSCFFPNLFYAKNLSQDTINRLSPTSLNRYDKTIYSQSGEDGVIEEIFRRLGIREGFFVEFGAADGIWLSNTRHLAESNWSGVMIEANSNVFNELVRNYMNYPKVTCICEFVKYKGSNQGLMLDEIADKYFPNQEIDFLSIDIDGADYLILESLVRKPKIILIEVGLHWHPLLNVRIPDAYATQNRQQPLEVMIEIAKGKDYKAICFEGGNLFLVRNDLYHFFNDVPQDTVVLWRDGWRSAPDSHDYLINLRASDLTILKFEGNLNKTYPITKDF